MADDGHSLTDNSHSLPLQIREQVSKNQRELRASMGHASSLNGMNLGVPEVSIGESLGHAGSRMRAAVMQWSSTRE